ncbi:hypothetical protein [Bradyrhizobium erythrophlei]|uniref:Uncharacterized protein n=1 Tax=Bradyrhizobium erythrophlei TaxID=1437360 RepID=A0A1M5RZU1_9BRAD|nr:hypothetical protein [Bradyrhizobium erythrophlei]SHH31343.1 hypothetical protein SAMN05443248_4413 [Bradyrhizobium erythrophlei]
MLGTNLLDGVQGNLVAKNTKFFDEQLDQSDAKARITTFADHVKVTFK